MLLKGTEVKVAPDQWLLSDELGVAEGKTQMNQEKHGSSTICFISLLFPEVHQHIKMYKAFVILQHNLQNSVKTNKCGIS